MMTRGVEARAGGDGRPGRVSSAWARGAAAEDRVERERTDWGLEGADSVVTKLDNDGVDSKLVRRARWLLLVGVDRRASGREIGRV